MLGHVTRPACGAVWAVLAVGFAPPAHASFQLMQIEQVIGGVGGDTSAQAIQLRMRALGQNLLHPAQIRAWDANGKNPVLIIDFSTSVPNGVAGARILIAGKGFGDQTSPAAQIDFAMQNLIPESYLSAGSLTYEQAVPNVVYWRLSWGGAGYAGDTHGDSTNDDDPGLDPADFGPPFPESLPSSCTQALLFAGGHSALSTSNDADYGLTAGAATFHNNNGDAFVVIAGDSCTVNGDCSDGNACTDDTCISGCCRFTNHAGGCNDGLFCTLSDVCSGGVCSGGGDRCPADAVACTVESCDEAGDQCLQVSNHAACQNGLFCDGVEVCDSVLGCADGADPCTPPLVCDEAGDRCVTCLNDPQCNDGLFCNGAETCNTPAGLCQAGANPCPADKIDCTFDSCDEAGHACLHVPIDDGCQNGLFCDGIETCDSLMGCMDGADPCDLPLACDEIGDRCVNCLADTDCNDGHFCNGDETCDLATGVCEPGDPPCPADSVECTVDLCDEPSDQCLHVPDHAFCTNGLFCDGAEVCDPAVGCVDGVDACAVPLRCDEPADRCVVCLTNMDCDDGLFCTGAETCNTFTGLCQAGPDPCPADNVSCTTDSCNEAADMCQHVPNHAACQNGLFCDGVEACDPLTGCVDAADPCTPPMHCNESTDQCVSCLSDAQCNDGQFCNGPETCLMSTGQCQAGALPCPPDAVVCTTESCNEAVDACQQTLDDAACQNGLFCDGIESCHPTLDCQDGPDPCVPPLNCNEGFDLCEAAAAPALTLRGLVGLFLLLFAVQTGIIVLRRRGRVAGGL